MIHAAVKEHWQSWAKPYVPPLTWNDILDIETALIRHEPPSLALIERLVAEVKIRRSER